MTDLGDPKQVKKLKRAAKTAEQIAQEDLRDLLEHRAFRNFVWTMLEKCRIHQISFTEGCPDTGAYNEGHRNVGNKLIALLEDAAPHSYMRIYTENRKDDHA